MSAVLNQPAPEQMEDPVLVAGQKFISERWNSLAGPTRGLLMKSGFYGPRGNRLQPDDPPGHWIPETDVERLEAALGTFKQCLGAKLPTRKELGAPIPVEALTEDVISSCESLMMVPQWLDPEFLRYGLLAVVVHEEANALSMVVPEKSPSVSAALFKGLAKTALVLLGPYGLASGLMAAMRQDLWSAMWGFYLLGVGIVAARSRSAETLEPPRRAPRAEDSMPAHFEYAYNAWQRFRYLRQFGLVGASGRFHLERMANEGILVPPVAFDLCEALRLRLQSVAAEAPQAR